MSTSNKFTITYPSGLGQHVEVCDAQSVKEFANRHFGSVDYADQGVTVEMEPYEPEAAAEATPVMEQDDPPSVDAEDEGDEDDAGDSK